MLSKLEQILAPVKIIASRILLSSALIASGTALTGCEDEEDDTPTYSSTNTTSAAGNSDNTSSDTSSSSTSAEDLDAPLGSGLEITYPLSGQVVGNGGRITVQGIGARDVADFKIYVTTDQVYPQGDISWSLNRSAGGAWSYDYAWLGGTGIHQYNHIIEVRETHTDGTIESAIVTNVGRDGPYTW